MAIINVGSLVESDVQTAINGSSDGDTVQLPAGSATWTATLTITKNITLAGAGENNTIITENLTRTGNIPLISVSLTKDMASPAYSFRLTGFEFKSLNTSGTALQGDAGFIVISGFTTATTIPTPYVRGCVSRVRIDHLKLTNMVGIAVKLESVLGVADHIVYSNIGTSYTANAMSIWHTNWTPALDPATGNPIPSTYAATNAWGSWADDNYFGTDKFWFYEDCSFEVPSNTNATDDQQGARAVWRHCTVINGAGFASHGWEGRRQPGVRVREIYNNNLITTRVGAQNRSGSFLYFNNKSTGQPDGPAFKNYRNARYESNQGIVSGDCRYDLNDVAAGILYTGTVTAVDSNARAGITGSNANFNLINLTNGSEYVVKNLSQPITITWPEPDTTGLDNDPGWQFKASSISGVSGQHLSFYIDSTFSTLWAVGHTYEIRKVLSVYGNIGLGKHDLLNTTTVPANGGSYTTYKYPATSGPKATYPPLNYPLDPAYSWNNTDDTNGYLNFAVVSGKSNFSGRNFYSLSERTIETQQVGFPAVTYSKATSDWPLIGEDQDIAYTPYAYPHPLQTIGGGGVGSIISISGNMTFGNVIIGEAPTSTLTIANTGDASFDVTNITLPTGFTLTGTTSFTVAAGAHVDRTVTFTPLLEQLYSGVITVTNNAGSGASTKACSGTGVVGSGGGHGKGHKKGVLSRRA